MEKLGFDTAENGPLKVCQKLANSFKKSSTKHRSHFVVDDPVMQHLIAAFHATLGAWVDSLWKRKRRLVAESERPVEKTGRYYAELRALIGHTSRPALRCRPLAVGPALSALR